MQDLRVFDIVDVVTDPRQEEVYKATVLELTEFEGEEAVVIQYHHLSCQPQTIVTKYVFKTGTRW